MRAWLFSLVFAPFALIGLEVQPWFGDVYQLHFLGSYAYSRFHSVDHGTPQLKDPFNAHVIYTGLDVALSPYWSFDADMQLADTTKQSFTFRSIAFQARYLWFDDVTGDPVSLVTGSSMRFTSSQALRDFSCPSHGHLDIEVNASLGKEVAASDSWLFRGWLFAAIGQATRGSPWIRAIGSLETNIHDQHKIAFFTEWVNGYGRHSRVNTDRFFGYGRIREKAVDVGLRYGYQIDVWGTVRFEYIRRVFAKSAPERVNTFIFSYLLPFSF